MRSLDVMNKNTFVNVCRELFLTLVTLYRPRRRQPKVISSFQTEMDLKTGNISSLASSGEALVPVYPGPSPRPPCRCSSWPSPTSCSSTSSSTSYSHWTGTYIHCHWVKALVSMLCCNIFFWIFLVLLKPLSWVLVSAFLSDPPPGLSDDRGLSPEIQIFANYGRIAFINRSTIIDGE